MRILIVVALLLLAGCANPDSETQGGTTIQYTDPERNITVDAPTLPSAAPLPGERTLNETPQWKLGEYWVIEMYDFLTGGSYTTTRVVAGTEHGNYLVGFPIDEFHNDVMVLHTPGYGDIQASNLAYEAHDVLFEPLQFPLQYDVTWSTAWEAPGATGDFMVESLDYTNQTATITSSATGQGGPNGRYIYDANLGEFSEFTINGYATWSVVEHGFDYNGTVRVPHAHDLVFFNGRIAQAGDIGKPLLPPTPAGPTETITIPEGYDRLSFAHIFVDLPGATQQSVTGQDASLGVYRIKTTSPQGDVYETLLTPNLDQSIYVDFFGHEGPAGDWTMEVEMAGAGYALLEGIGYHSIDIKLPSGCVITSNNAQHHGTLCQAG